MQIFISIASFVLGVILVVKGGDWFVDAASWIAKAARIPSFVIGATIVSFATTLPEMIVSIVASIDGKNDMAVGNAIGSVTANTGLILAIAFICMTIAIDRKKYIKQCLILIATAATLWAGCISGSLQPWAIAALVVMFVMFVIFSVKEAKESQEETEEVSVNRKATAKNIVLFIVGAACIVLGSDLLVDGGSAIAVLLGVPERVIAVTMVAIGTSLPELVTTVTAIVKKETNLSIGNIVGANIIDLALILPVCSAVNGTGFTVSSQSLAMDFPACFIITVIAIVPMLIKEKAYKIQGWIMLAVYALYLMITI